MIKILLGIALVWGVATIPYLDQRCLANSLIVGRDDFQDLYNWECKVCDETNKPRHSHPIEESAQDIKCILSVYDELGGFLVLAFRYTNTVQNVWEDILYPFQTQDELFPSGCKVQNAYLQMWKSIDLEVVSDIKALMEWTGYKVLYITGISMGGGLAALSYHEIQDEIPELERIEMVTFGAPRVGNNKWAAEFDRRTDHKTKRYYIKGDPIVALPSCLIPLICTYDQTGIPIECVDDDETCYQKQVEMEGKKTLLDVAIESKALYEANKDVGSIIDHINGYPYIYNYTLEIQG